MTLGNKQMLEARKDFAVRYFFYIIDNGQIIPDEEGSECSDLDAAKEEAKASALDLARQAIHRGWRPTTICVEIQDGEGRVLSALKVQEIFEHPRRPIFDKACAQTNQPRQ